MCGIAGIYLKAAAPDVLRERIEPFVDMLYKGIEHRGKHATGFVAVSRSGEIRIDKDHVTASKFIRDREAMPADPQMILLHTRYKTKGSEKDFRNNHPVIWKTCFTTHNGSISNDDRLFERYQLERHAEVDSEIIPALMYQTGFDVEKMREYLDQLIGPMAMATINPTEYPGKLILARTHSSPLHIFNTKQMVLWASEVDAMREAWAKIFGTPPDKQRFIDVKNRTMLIVENDKMTKYDIPYKVNYVSAKPPVRQEFDDRPERGGDAHAFGFGSGWTPKPEESEETPVGVNYAVSNDQIKGTVAGIRASGGGVAITFAEMRTLPYHEQQGPWRTCEICGIMVKSDDITTTIRGAICCDCKTVWEEQTRRLRDTKDVACDDGSCIKQPDFAQEYDQIGATLNGLNVQLINFWGQDEDFLHVQTLKQMCDNLPIDPEVLDYILFRADSDAVENNEVLGSIIPLLLEMYEVIREQLSDWLDYDDEDAIYERFTHEKPEEKEPEQLPFRFAAAVVGESSKNPRKCRHCRGKTHAVIERDGTKITYCAKHFDRCSARGCKAKANHTRADGTRVCHTHARNVKACWADSALRQEGYAIGVEE